MTTARPARRAPAPKGMAWAQAWVELRADDPEAVSALGVARARLAAGRRLQGLRRLRIFELRGGLPGRATIEDLLHRSTWFYNPHKERCVLRASVREASPVGADEQAVLVTERGGERRPAAERWWRHETGQAVEVREGVAWLLRFESGEDARARAAELAVRTGRGRGLLCNPNAQQHALAAPGAIPLAWIGAETAAEEGEER